MAFRLVIDRPPIQQLERRGKRIVCEIYRELKQSPKQLIPSWDEPPAHDRPDRAVCDSVAGMTDAYAEKVYRWLFVPGVGSSDEL